MASNPSQAVANVLVRDVWKRLNERQDAVLIDVRTRAEWTYVGVPDLSALGRQTVLVEWLGFPDNRVNADFVPQLTRELEALGAGKDTELYFVCRSGARSLQAAQAMLGAGWSKCFNVAEGFEGPLDEAKHRGSRSGWKAENLPWVQG